MIPSHRGGAFADHSLLVERYTVDENLYTIYTYKTEQKQSQKSLTHASTNATL